MGFERIRLFIFIIISSLTSVAEPDIRPLEHNLWSHMNDSMCLPPDDQRSSKACPPTCEGPCGIWAQCGNNLRRTRSPYTTFETKKKHELYDKMQRRQPSLERTKIRSAQSLRMKCFSARGGCVFLLDWIEGAAESPCNISAWLTAGCGLNLQTPPVGEVSNKHTRALK